MLVCAKLVSNLLPKENIAIGVEFPEIAEKWFNGATWIKKQLVYKINPDIVLYGGGGQFYSFPETTLTKDVLYYYGKFKKILSSDIGINRIIKHFIWYIQRKKIFPALKGSYTGTFCVGVGPFVSRSKEIKWAQDLFKKCDFISVRDNQSKHLLETWGIKKVILGTDPVFLKELWLDDNSKILIDRKLNNHVLFIFRSWPHIKEGHSYISKIIECGNHLRAVGIKVTFASFDEQSDRELFSSFFINEELLIWRPKQYTPSTFINYITNNFDLVVSARAHGVLLPAMLGVPGICVRIEPKLQNIHSMLPNGTTLWQDPFDSNTLLKIITEILQNLSLYRIGILKNVKKNIEIIQNVANEFILWLKSII